MAIGMLLGVLAGTTTPALILLTRSESNTPTTYIVLAAPDNSVRGYIDGEAQP